MDLVLVLFFLPRLLSLSFRRFPFFLGRGLYLLRASAPGKHLQFGPPALHFLMGDELGGCPVTPLAQVQCINEPNGIATAAASFDLHGNQPGKYGVLK